MYGPFRGETHPMDNLGRTGYGVLDLGRMRTRLKYHASCTL
jgi:hypothetical protein